MPRCCAAVPFQPVHLLFINLLTDSLPAIAIGMEPARQGLLDRKPRDPKASILSRGLLTAIGNPGPADRRGHHGWLLPGLPRRRRRPGLHHGLFHSDPWPGCSTDFNCRGRRASSAWGWGATPASVWAFLAGVALLLLALFTPGLKSLFLVSPAFGLAELGQVALLALTPTVLIQLYKSLRR